MKNPDGAAQSRARVSDSIGDALEAYLLALRGQPCTTLYQTTMALVEARLLQFALKNCDGNVSAAAKMLGISRTTLARKLAALRQDAREAD